MHINDEEHAEAGATDDTDRSGYDGIDRRSWRGEAAILRHRLDSIEELARDTQGLSRLTHDTIVAHVAEERETKAAIDELILLWRGSKMMVSAFKILIPVVATLVSAAWWLTGWVREHVKW